LQKLRAKFRLLDAIFRLRNVAAFLLLLLAGGMAALWPAPRRMFKYYLFSPIPGSVRDIQYSGEWLGINPEPVCFLRFTASPADLELILKKQGFKPAESSFNASGPPWWDIDKRGAGTSVFVRQYSPAKESRWYVGKNRRWTEVLRVDSTGTNIYFLVWGI
jgi:hypothetical protein